ncbi:MAG: hypothetical protein GC191_04185 [Azospirillum sp.]|nr:hypothetical protein [Azospirillum sp.]
MVDVRVGWIRADIAHVMVLGDFTYQGSDRAELGLAAACNGHPTVILDLDRIHALPLLGILYIRTSCRGLIRRGGRAVIVASLPTVEWTLRTNRIEYPVYRSLTSAISAVIH